MYRALHLPSENEIIILDPRWKTQTAYLRTLDQQNKLVCPICKEPVRVRAGQIKRAHFAHKHLKNCPFGRESARLLQTRAIIYDWLVEKFEATTVSVEKRLDSHTRMRPFDCWVKKEKNDFVYWIFDRLMPPDERQILLKACKEKGLDVQWIFVNDLLRPDEISTQSRLHLTTTERAFMRKSEFDQAWQTHFEQLGSSLHYIDPDLRILTTYRNLIRIHKPQLYAGKRLQNPLSNILVSKQTGEFIHPGERTQLESSRHWIAEQQRQSEEQQKKAKNFLKKASFTNKLPSIRSQKITNSSVYERSGTCRVCGIVTSDWVSYFGETRECICRGCKDPT
jgi:competence CoiA-like predicted nuclease